MLKRCLLLGSFIACPATAQAPGIVNPGYHSQRGLTAALDSLARRYPRLVNVSSLVKSPGGRDVYAIRLAVGPEPDQRPALLVVANTNGPDVISSEAALAVAGRLAAAYGGDSAVTRLLDRNVVYLIPRANPDAAEAMFATPLGERVRNDAAFDDDRDQVDDEDGPEDLNGDGLITLMRIEDPAGDWMPDSAEPGLMRKADPARGEVGRYQVYPEGRDNDGDQAWNEDPPGGVDPNRSFSYGYTYFSTGAGNDPLDAPEARAVAQFFVDHPNVAVVYVLGPQDNLLKAWETKKGASSDDPPTSVMDQDEAWYAEVSHRFQRTTGLDKGPASAALEGDPLSFAYYHMGRWTFGTRTWWAPEGTDTTSKRPEKAPGGGGDKDPLKDERTALRWLRQNRPDGFKIGRASCRERVYVLV